MVQFCAGLVVCGALSLALPHQSVMRSHCVQPTSAPGRQDKARRTPAQQKIGSNLLDALRQRTGQAVESPRPSPVEIDEKGRVLVDIRADVTDAVLKRIKDLGGDLVNIVPRYQSIRARVPLEKLETLATMSEVKSIRSADKAVTRVPALAGLR